MHRQEESEVMNTFKIPRKSLNKDNWSHNNCNIQDESGEMKYNNLYEPDYPTDLPSRSFQRPDHFLQFHRNTNQLLDCDSGENNVSQPNVNPTLYSKQNLKLLREVPKSNGSGRSDRSKDVFPHLSCPSLPKELKEQFQPLFCKLCGIHLSSNIMAKLHYKSKNHEKKVRKYLKDYSSRTGEPLHSKAEVSVKKQKTEDNNDPKYFYCNVCDLPLTGRMHAESHYMGKNHNKAVLGRAPAGSGHYNEEGKWVRRFPQAALPGSPDNIGLDFAGADLTPKKDFINQTLRCDMCEVQVTSHQQLQLHLSGQKHKKRLQQQESTAPETSTPGDPENNILSTLSTDSIPTGDLSVYRTPTGYYYCNPCNLSLNSELQFKQHLASKKHRKKANTNKE